MNNDKPRAIVYCEETWEHSLAEHCAKYARDEGYMVVFLAEISRNGDYLDKLLEMA